MRFSCISEPQRNATSSVDVGLAEPDHFAARPHRFAASAGTRADAGRFQHDIGAAAAASAAARLRRTSSFASVDRVRRAELAGKRSLSSSRSTAMTVAGARHARALHGGQAHRAAADHHHGVAIMDRRRHSARRRRRSSRRSRSGRPDRTATPSAPRSPAAPARCSIRRARRDTSDASARGRRASARGLRRRTARRAAPDWR